MSRPVRSAVMTAEVEVAARRHLLRQDGQEDLCFALWRPSRGASRLSALIYKLLLPHDGERIVHGNVSFQPQYLVRAMSEAAAAGAGLALMHSHPLGRGWQLMSRDDIFAERGNAPAIFGATSLPFVGLTLAGNGAWSARFWERTAPKTYTGKRAGTVRVLGNELKMHYNPITLPVPDSTDAQIRTISAWGKECQADLARLRVGVVGTGSVGGFVAETLARTGVEDIVLIDYDIIEKYNLDRLNFATRDDVGDVKVDVLSRYLQCRTTAAKSNIETVQGAIYEEEVFRKALDCDLIFSCVDRPWGRHVLNFIAYAHLIPVVDGGIAVRTNKLGKISAADWKAHVVTHGRQCLECIGQYDSGLVQTEREGLLDEPKYIEGLPDGHPLKSRQNVFAFSMSCASLQVLQMLAFTISPLGRSNPGGQMYHFVGGFMEQPNYSKCHPNCLFTSLTAAGDSSPYIFTGHRPVRRDDS